LKWLFKKEWVIAGVILCVMALFITTNYFYRTKFGLKVIPLEKVKHFFSFHESVKTAITVNIGSGDILRLDISFPCNDRKQHAELTRNLSGIVNDFLMETDQKQLGMWIQQRNIPAIKTRLLRIANQYTDKTVTSVFFEALNW